LKKHLILNKLKNRLFGRYPSLSYSRSGEDLIIEEFFRNQQSGFYVDIGAYHPINHSNSYKYYLKGWRGINIDPNKKAIELFHQVKPQDINLHMAIGDFTGEIEYYSFSNDDSMNTVSKSFVDSAVKNSKLRIDNVTLVKIDSLENIFAKHLPLNQKIDFMTVDVEGFDLKVLQSNNWIIYRPKVLCVELEATMESVMATEIATYMKEQNYNAKAFVYLNESIGNIIFTEAQL
jgi:FkbM family methyltransferase